MIPRQYPKKALALVMYFVFLGAPLVSNATVNIQANTSSNLGSLAAAGMRCAGVTSQSISGMISSAANSLVASAGGLISEGLGSLGGSIVDLGVSQGSQAIADVGNYLRSGIGEGALSGMMGGLGSFGVSSVMSIFGGGGMIPVDTKTINREVDFMQKKETCFDAIARAEAKHLLSQVNSAAANWINTGLNGNPFFPRNMGDYYRRVANNQTNILLGQIRESGSPFANEILPTVIQANRNQTNAFRRQMRDSLPQVAGGQAQANRFRAGDPSACPGSLYYSCFQNIIFNPGSSALLGTAASLNEAENKKAAAIEDAREKIVNGAAPLEGCTPGYERIEEDTGEVYCLHPITMTPAVIAVKQAEEVTLGQQRLLQNAEGDTDSILDDWMSGFLNTTFNEGFLYSAEDSDVLDSIEEDYRETNAVIERSLLDTLDYAQALSADVALWERYIGEVRDTHTCYVNLDNAFINSDTYAGQALPSTRDPLADNYTNISRYELALSEYRNAQENSEWLIETLRGMVNQISGNASAAGDIWQSYVSLEDQIPTAQMRAQSLVDYQMLQQEDAEASSALSACQAELAPYTATAVIEASAPAPSYWDSW